jgi:hypothetical protein
VTNADETVVDVDLEQFKSAVLDDELDTGIDDSRRSRGARQTSDRASNDAAEQPRLRGRNG